MKVALGTYEIEDEDRKAIKKALGFRGGKASRTEARDFLLAAVDDKLAGLQNTEASVGSGNDNESEDGEL